SPRVPTISYRPSRSSTPAIVSCSVSTRTRGTVPAPFSSRSRGGGAMAASPGMPTLPDSTLGAVQRVFDLFESVVEHLADLPQRFWAKTATGRAAAKGVHQAPHAAHELGHVLCVRLPGFVFEASIEV